VVRFYLSLFSINKVIKLAKKVTKALFEPIITPADLESVQEIVGEMKVFLPDLLSRYLPRLSTIPLCQGMSWVPTWKSLPTVCFFDHNCAMTDVLRRRDNYLERTLYRSFLLKCSKWPLMPLFWSLYTKRESSGRQVYCGPIESDMRSTRTTNCFQELISISSRKRSVLSYQHVDN